MNPYQKTHQTLVRALAGDQDAREAATELLLRGVRTYLNAGGDIDLARCVGLPTPTAKNKFSQLQRDYWLCMAAGQITGLDAWPRSMALAAEMKTFTSRVWPRWKDEDEPPPGASRLYAFLFRALSAAPDKTPSTARHLHRIVGEDTAIINERKLDIKSIKVVERESRMEWMASSWLRDEFRSLESYLAFRRAEARGRFTFAHSLSADTFPDGNVTSQNG